MARKNVRRNGATSAVRIATGGVEAMVCGRQADLVLANIQADVLMANADALLGAVAPGGWLVLSGILAQELVTVRSTFRRHAGTGWHARSRRLGEWADLALHRRTARL